ECAIGHNQLNSSGNSPLMWAIQNKHCGAVKEQRIYHCGKKKNELHENMRKDLLQMSLLKDEYQLSAHVKNKIN
ncbi:hypothetical protein PCYB_002210, partial [Plasmodium cynomolgi strain B]